MLRTSAAHADRSVRWSLHLPLTVGQVDFKEQTYHTRIAHVIHAQPQLLEIRYKPGAILDMDAVKEVHEMRKRIFGNSPYATISILPDDVIFELAVMQQDHYAPQRAADPLIAWAVVGCGSVQETVARLYFSKFPQTFPVLTTQDEDEARTWIAAQLDRTLKTAS